MVNAAMPQRRAVMTTKKTTEEKLRDAQAAWAERAAAARAGMSTSEVNVVEKDQ